MATSNVTTPAALSLTLTWSVAELRAVPLPNQLTVPKDKNGNVFDCTGYNIVNLIIDQVSATGSRTLFSTIGANLVSANQNGVIWNVDEPTLTTALDTIVPGVYNCALIINDTVHTLEQLIGQGQCIVQVQG